MWDFNYIFWGRVIITNADLNTPANSVSNAGRSCEWWQTRRGIHLCSSGGECRTCEKSGCVCENARWRGDSGSVYPLCRGSLAKGDLDGCLKKKSLAGNAAVRNKLILMLRNVVGKTWGSPEWGRKRGGWHAAKKQEEQHFLFLGLGWFFLFFFLPPPRGAGGEDSLWRKENSRRGGE